MGCIVYIIVALFVGAGIFAVFICTTGFETFSIQSVLLAAPDITSEHFLDIATPLIILLVFLLLIIHCISKRIISTIKEHRIAKEKQLSAEEERLSIIRTINKRLIAKEKLLEAEEKRLEKEQEEEKALIAERARRAKEREEARKALEERAAEERRHLAAQRAEKIKDIVQQFTPTDIVNRQTGTPFDVDPLFVNKDVVYVVQTCKEGKGNRDIYQKYVSAYNEIRCILACVGCQTVSDQYYSLFANMDRLKHLKRKHDLCVSLLFRYKIQLLNEDIDLLRELKAAFDSLRKSIICKTESGTLDDIFPAETPTELALFLFDEPPVTLRLNGFYLCLFSNVILVFDRTGTFSTAVDPYALRIVTTRQQTTIRIIDGRTIGHYPFIAHDSKCISQGQTQSRWLHARQDGAPDRRYSTNTQYEYRADIYEYSEIRLEFADSSITFSASSGMAADRFEEVAPKYWRKCNDRHEPLPELMQLLDLLCDADDGHLDALKEACESRADSYNYFYKLILP